jgi:hypothetical protein
MPDAQNGIWAADIWQSYTAGGGVSGPLDISPPSTTTDNKAAGVALANKTFGAFTGADVGEIDNYNLVTTNAAGACSWSGSGLGPYTPTSADGDAGTIYLQARNSSNEVLATAIHSYVRLAASGGIEKVFDTQDLSDVDIEAAGPGSYTFSDSTPYTYADNASGAAACAVSSGVITVQGGGGSDYSYLHIDLGTAIDAATVFLCAKITMNEDSPGSGFVLFMLGDGTNNVNPTGALQHVTRSTTSAGWRMRSSGSFVDFTDRTITATAAASYLTRACSVAAGANVEVWNGSTRPGPTDTVQTIEAKSRSTGDDDRRYLTVIANVAFDLDIAVYRVRSST